jgi:hypothetical protein
METDRGACGWVGRQGQAGGHLCRLNCPLWLWSWQAPKPVRTWQLVPVVEAAGHVEAHHCAVLGGERHG